MPSLITLQVKAKVIAIVNCFETGSVTGKYDAIAILNDNPVRGKQVTYGKSQASEFGGLPLLLKEYEQRQGYLNQVLTQKLPDLAKLVDSRTGKDTILSRDHDFIQLLHDLARDPLMQQVQDQFFDQHYFSPAYYWFTDNGFTLPLSLLVIYDSFIQSGSIPQHLRARFPTVPPVQGGNEKNWISDYVTARDEWLESISYLKTTEYRTKDFLDAIDAGDWMLAHDFNANGTLIK